MTSAPVPSFQRVDTAKGRPQYPQHSPEKAAMENTPIKYRKKMLT